MISLARVAARYPRALVNELEEVNDYLIIEDGPLQVTIWKRQQAVPTTLSEQKESRC